MATKIFHGVSSTFGGAIDMSGGVQFQVGTFDSSVGAPVPVPGPLGSLPQAVLDLLGIGRAPTANLAVQNAQIQSQRPVQEFYDLFSSNVYYVSGRSQTQCSMDRILGPKGSMANLYKALSDPCQIGTNVAVLTMKGKYCVSGTWDSTPPGSVDVLAGGDKLTMSNCIMDRVSIAMRAQDFLFTEQFSFKAIDLISG